MNGKEKEKLVKELYEKYPYPNREITTKKEAEKYVKWVSRIFGEGTSFWKGKKVLELGCGTGELACGLALAGANVTAIDFSSTSIKKAKKTAKRLGTNVLFKEKNILEFSSKQKFDVIVALGSLHHTINARKGFKIAAKHVKKKGIIIVGLYNKYSRARHRMKRFLLWLFCGTNIEKRISFGKKWFKGNEAKSWLADKYGQVHESYHSIREVLNWFCEEKIDFLESYPKYNTPTIDEVLWFVKRKNAFFVMIGKKR